MDRNKQNMNLVLYALFHLRSLDEVRENRFMYNPFERFVNEFSETQKLEIIDSIELALRLKNIDESHNLPKLPFDENFKREYLNIVLGHFKSAIA